MRGDRDGEFEELFKYYPAVVAFLRRFGFPSEQIRDLAQDVFLRVYQGMSDYRGEAHVTYLRKVARNVALNKIRDEHAGKRDAILVSEENLASLVSDLSSPDAIVARRLDARRLRQAIERLDDSLRVCVLLYLAEFSYLEIGNILGISQSALKSRLHAAREKLRKLLTETESRGGSDDR